MHFYYISHDQTVLRAGVQKQTEPKDAMNLLLFYVNENVKFKTTPKTIEKLQYIAICIYFNVFTSEFLDQVASVNF